MFSEGINVKSEVASVVFAAAKALALVAPIEVIGNKRGFVALAVCDIWIAGPLDGAGSLEAGSEGAGTTWFCFAGA